MFIMLNEILDDDGEEIFPLLDETGATVHVAKTMEAACAWFDDQGGLVALAGTNSNAMFEEMTGARIKDERWTHQLSGKSRYDSAPSDRVPIPPRPQPEVLASFGERQRRRQAERKLRKYRPDRERRKWQPGDDGWELL